MEKSLNIRSETMKLLGKKTQAGSYLTPYVGDGFFESDIKTKAKTKAKINTRDSIKLKTFCAGE